MIGWLLDWGWAAGAALIVGAVLLLAVAVRRARVAARRRRVAARVRPVAGFRAGVVRPWHPSQQAGCADAATVLLPRVADRSDATMLLPRQRAGERRG
ncbi:hypothetical protein [Micromonospora tulbaghiae]|uniref:hypothetical protein n=1 Tax=Micromonospora tulbaghiae TaxID=479978 RepID=UPI0033C37A95